MLSFKNEKGQAFLEGLFAVMIITVIMFALIQVCVIVVNDVLYNETAFITTRAVIVTPAAKIRDRAQKVAEKAAMLNGLKFNNIEDSSENDGAKATNWNGTVLGADIKDHSGINLKKYNVKLKYKMKTMFAAILGEQRTRTQWARARMIKSPDEDFYYRAYPQAREFIKIGNGNK